MSIGLRQRGYTKGGLRPDMPKKEKPPIDWQALMRMGLQGHQMMNKFNETKLLETGYLTDAQYGFTTPGGDTLQNMFVRSAGDRGIGGYVTQPFRSVTDRIRINPAYENELIRLSELSGDSPYDIFSKSLSEKGMSGADIEALGSDLRGFSGAEADPRIQGIIEGQPMQSGPFGRPQLSRTLDKFNLNQNLQGFQNRLGVQNQMFGMPQTTTGPMGTFNALTDAGSVMPGIAGLGSIPAWNPMSTFGATAAASPALSAGAQAAIGAFGNPVTGAMPVNRLIEGQMQQILGGLGSQTTLATPALTAGAGAPIAEPGFFSKLFGGGGAAGGAAGGAGSGFLGGLGAAMGPIGWAMAAISLLGAFKKLFRSDRRLKENIVQVGKSSSGINIYEFNFKGNEDKYKGVMSDEVPWAVLKDSDGYDMVDYNQIDVTFEKVN